MVEPVSYDTYEVWVKCDANGQPLFPLQYMGGVEMFWGETITPEYRAQACNEIATRNLIERIGVDIGAAADLLVAHRLGPVLDCPAIPDAPDRVWAIAAAFWHEIVHRGIQIGRGESVWITGIYEFEYNDVLCLVQHIWLAFKEHTGLDFCDPEQSAILKAWLAASPRLSDREYADDMPSGDAARERLQHYIRYGGPSRAAQDPTIVVTMRGRTGTLEDYPGGAL